MHKNAIALIKECIIILFQCAALRLINFLNNILLI